MSPTKIEKVRGSSAHQTYRLADGTKVVGASTVVKCIGNESKIEGLMYWAVGLHERGLDRRTYRDGQASVGTLIHLLIQHDIQGTTPDTDDYSPNELRLANVALDRYRAWKAGRDIRAIWCERQLVSEKWRFGGTPDLYVEMDGRRGIVDVKTAKAIYEDHWAQTSGYAELVRENGEPVEFIAILRAGRTEEESFSFAIATAEDADAYWQMFRGALDIHHARNRIKYAKK